MKVALGGGGNDRLRLRVRSTGSRGRRGLLRSAACRRRLLLGQAGCGLGVRSVLREEWTCQIQECSHHSWTQLYEMLFVSHDDVKKYIVDSVNRAASSGTGLLLLRLDWLRLGRLVDVDYLFLHL